MWSFRRNLMLLLLSLGLSACTSLPQSVAVAPVSSRPTPPVMRVCTSFSSAQMNVEMAIAEQMDAKYGIKLDVTTVNNGSTAASALIAGEFDLCQNAASGAVNAIAAGGDLVIVGGVLNSQPYYLITRPDINEAADLVGKALAIAGPGSGSDFAARVALDYLGLRPDQDVALQTIGGASERIAAMQTEAIAGTILAPPEAMTVLAEGGNLLVDFADLDQKYQHIAMITSRSFLREHPEQIEAYLKATAEAVALMHAYKARTLAVMADYLELDPIADATAMDLTYAMVIQRLMQVEPMPTTSGVQALIEDLARENPAVASLAPADVIDVSAIERLRDAGFFEQLRKQYLQAQ